MLKYLGLIFNSGLMVQCSCNIVFNINLLLYFSVDVLVTVSIILASIQIIFFFFFFSKVGKLTQLSLLLVKNRSCTHLFAASTKVEYNG